MQGADRPIKQSHSKGASPAIAHARQKVLLARVLAWRAGPVHSKTSSRPATRPEWDDGAPPAHWGNAKPLLSDAGNCPTAGRGRPHADAPGVTPAPLRQPGKDMRRRNIHRAGQVISTLHRAPWQDDTTETQCTRATEPPTAASSPCPKATPQQGRNDDEARSRQSNTEDDDPEKGGNANVRMDRMTKDSHSHSTARKRRRRSLVRDLSIRYKLMAVIMITCVAALSVSGVIFLAWEWNSLRHSLVRDLSSHAEVLGNNCRAALTFEDPADATDVLRSVEVLPSILVACVYTNDGSLFAVYTRDGTTATIPRPAPAESRHRFKGGFLTLTHPILRQDREIGTVCLKATLDAMHLRLKRSAIIIAAVVLLSCAAAYLVSARLQRLISSPILYLAGVANFVSEKKQYDVRAAYDSRDEMGLLMQAFNDMLEQIQQRDAALVKANERLEVRVQARTAELTAANDRLTREIAVRKSAERAMKQRTERILHHQRTLLRLTKNARHNLESTIRKTTEEVAKTLSVERVSVWFFDDTASELACQDLYRAASDSHESGVCFKTTDYPAFFKAIEDTRTVALAHLRQDPRGREILHDYLIPLDITSAMGVAIRPHGKTLGFVCCAHVGPPREWSLEEQDFTASIADMLALQLETCERRRVERALANANEHLAETVTELRRSNKELQDFTYVAAHDLKAPLRAIGTLTDWITSDYAEMFDDPGREQLRLLKARVSRMNELLDSVLHYSRIGRVAAQREKIDVNKAVAEAIARINPPQHIQFAVDENMPLVVCEKGHVQQIFHQLIGNAVKYMDKSHGRIEIGCTQEQHVWKITVTDNGPGIEEKYFEKIFQMFQTLAPRDECESTGIGLAIVKKIVELHGGSIGVESRLGKGTTFFFTLPRHRLATPKVEMQTHAAR